MIYFRFTAFNVLMSDLFSILQPAMFWCLIYFPFYSLQCSDFWVIFYFTACNVLISDLFSILQPVMFWCLTWPEFFKSPTRERRGKVQNIYKICFKDKKLNFSTFQELFLDNSPLSRQSIPTPGTAILTVHN